MEHYKITAKIGEYSLEISSHDKEWFEAKAKEYESLLNILKQLTEKETKKKESDSSQAIRPSLDSISVNEFYKNNISGKVNQDRRLQHSSYTI